MGTRYPLLVVAVAAAVVLVAAPLAALADCADSHVSVAKTEQPPKVTEPSTVFVPSPDTAGLQAKAVEPSPDRPAATEAKPAVR